MDNNESNIIIYNTMVREGECGACKRGRGGCVDESKSACGTF